RLQRLRDPVERDFETLLEALGFEETQLFGALVTPVLARASEEVTGRIALAHAAVFEDVDVLAFASAFVAADEATNSPACRHIRAAEVQEMLLRFVGGDEHHALLGERFLASRLNAKKAFEGVDAEARAAPVLVAVPFELGLHGFSHAPTVGEAELGEHGAGGREAEVLYEVLSQEPHGDRVDEERALSGEPDHASVGVELQELLVVQIVDAHLPDALLRIEVEGTSY